MKDKLHFTVQIEPRTKKNHAQIFKKKDGTPFVAPSKQFKEYQDNCGWFVPKNLNIDYPVNVKCLFYMKTRRKCDLTNLLEAIDDVMVHYGTISDDNYTVIAAHDGSRVFYDKENPRTEVFIEPLEEVEK